MSQKQNGASLALLSLWQRDGSATPQPMMRAWALVLETHVARRAVGEHSAQFIPSPWVRHACKRPPVADVCAFRIPQAGKLPESSPEPSSQAPQCCPRTCSLKLGFALVRPLHGAHARLAVWHLQSPPGHCLPLRAGEAARPQCR